MREGMGIALAGLSFICSGAVIAGHQLEIGLMVMMFGAGCVGVAIGKRHKGS